MLNPSEFGVVSIALVYITFLQLFLDQGFAAALIQRQDLEPEHSDSVFWVDVVLSLGLVVLSILFSRWWATVNHSPEVAEVITVLSLCIPIEALAIVQQSLLARELDFKSLSIRSNGATIVGGVIGIAMAYVGWGVWALVGQQIVRDVTALALLWKLSGWRPRLSFSYKHLVDLISFSTSTFIAQLADFANAQVGSVVLGLFFGPIAVGLYRLAERLSYYVLVVATSSIQVVSLPEFSRLQRKPDELRKSALNCVRWSSAATLPALAGLACVSGPLMAIVGAKWMPASNVLKILCFLEMLIMFAYFTPPLMQALGKVRQLAMLGWARTFVGVALFVVAGLLVRSKPITWQIMGIALARFANGVFLVTPVFLCIFMRLCRISARDFAKSITPSVLSCLGIAGSIILFQASGVMSGDRPFVLLAGQIVVGGATGLSVLLWFDKELRYVATAILQRAAGTGIVPLWLWLTRDW